jgi:hypothetical protein
MSNYWSCSKYYLHICTNNWGGVGAHPSIFPWVHTSEDGHEGEAHDDDPLLEGELHDDDRLMHGRS